MRRLCEGISLDEHQASLETIPGVPGRVEAVNAGQPYAVIVDYAHTPDGLENVLKAVKEFADGRIICVFGCGGDRDRTKRPIMGQSPRSYADHADRYERIILGRKIRNLILRDIEAGLEAVGHFPDRYEL